MVGPAGTGKWDFFLVVLHDERGLHGISLVFGPPESVFLAALAIVGLVAS